MSVEVPTSGGLVGEGGTFSATLLSRIYVWMQMLGLYKTNYMFDNYKIIQDVVCYLWWAFGDSERSDDDII